MTQPGATAFYLVYMSLRGHLPLFIQQYLFDLIRVRVGDVLSKGFPLEDDVPEGSILSVTLFAVAINGGIAVLPEGVHSS